AKGLEYDHVIVVEPAEIVAAEPRGLNRLYVVLTRAVSRLAVLHAQPLPEPLR
ncbi:MAG TPA: ATP-binding domain-containing protein, partial [Rugosimonospora sp.]|nr:ATP-binding domain-containing protein [Rugosimonospora sp.]